MILFDLEWIPQKMHSVFRICVCYLLVTRKTSMCMTFSNRVQCTPNFTSFWTKETKIKHWGGFLIVIWWFITECKIIHKLSSFPIFKWTFATKNNFKLILLLLALEAIGGHLRPLEVLRPLKITGGHCMSQQVTGGYKLSLEVTRGHLKLLEGHLRLLEARRDH